MIIITKILAREHVKDVLFDLLYGVFLTNRDLIHRKTYNRYRESKASLCDDLIGMFCALS